MRHDRLVGIVTRADLVRAFTRTDEEIAHEIREDVVEHAIWAEPGTVEVEVERGHVKLAGRLQSRTDAQLLERLTRRVPGVVGVEAALSWHVDDTRRGVMRPAGARSTRS